VKYKGDKMNRFNLLSRVGRTKWRAVGRGVRGSVRDVGEC